MKGIHRFKPLSIVLIIAYLLSACSGVTVRSGNDPTSSGKGLPKEVAFTGTVDALEPGEITVGGQTVSIDARTVIDPTINVGDIVKVEAQVSDTGAVLAIKIALFGAEEANPTARSETPAPEAAETPTVEVHRVNVTPVPNTPAPTEPFTADTEKELLGVVNEITANSITVDGVVYQIASITEINGRISVRDRVKLHVIAHADGTFTIRQAEKINGDDSSDDHGNDDNEDEHEDRGSNDTENS